jgi:hypothetical protein
MLNKKSIHQNEHKILLFHFQKNTNIFINNVLFLLDKEVLLVYHFINFSKKNYCPKTLNFKKLIHLIAIGKSIYLFHWHRVVQNLLFIRFVFKKFF